MPLLSSIVFLFIARGLESRTEGEASLGEGVYARQHVLVLSIVTLIISGGLVVCRSHRVLRRRQHDLVAGRHTLLMMMVMMRAGHHLMMRLLVVLVVHAGVTGVIHRTLLHVFTSGSENETLE